MIKFTGFLLVYFIINNIAIVNGNNYMRIGIKLQFLIKKIKRFKFNVVKS